ncbi:hypothetical protein MAR_037707 [Mya arenaria]|uniref:DDE Tnp4 domain-containing protein n=1 Tax=Mya arenaria TaxID=6604 RepID=A0ABY7FT91_MYAAR|nr:hypothetical protein MAR_037707 [Mya arenaria]
MVNKYSKTQGKFRIGSIIAIFKYISAAETQYECSMSVVIYALYMRLIHILYWPDRDGLRKTMPLQFRKTLGQNIAVIIKCFEVLIQRPKRLARAQTWSSYKPNNTLKNICLSLKGSVLYFVKASSGRASDKWITEHCDRRFDIAERVGMCCATVNIPAFTAGITQLSVADLETK